MKDLIIIGASGFGREVAWLTERINEKKPTWKLLGFLDDNLELVGQEINGYRVLGTIKEITNMKDIYCVCAVGASRTREKIISNICNLNNDVKFATLIDPSVVKSDLVNIGEGSIICAHTIITVNVDIGKHNIINLDCTVGHQSLLGDFVTLYPSVNVSGNARLEKGVEIGTGTQIIQSKSIGEYTIVGAGAVVINDLPSKCIAFGVPARPQKYL